MKLYKILILLLIAGVVYLVYTKLTSQKTTETEIKIYDENRYDIGNVRIDKSNKEISFDAVVRKNTGWMQFLIYVEGYKWLKEDCAIVSSVKLSDLQKAFALLDWKLWDDLWYRKTTDLTKSVIVYIEFKKRQYLAEDFIKEKDKIDVAVAIKDLVFLGSPYFDTVVLDENPSDLCSPCPIYPLEQKSIRKEIGKKGYSLDDKLILPIKEKVKIIIKWAT